MSRTDMQRTLNAVQRPEAYGEVVIESGGVPVVLSVWRGRPERAAVLFLPGTMTHPLFYEELLDSLNLAGHTVVGLHPAAHGKSPRRPRGRRVRLTFGLLVRNALDALEWMRAQTAGAPLVVLGSSQGGILAMAVAARADGLAAVFAHNVLDGRLPGSMSVTRLPVTLASAYPFLTAALRGVARVVPWLPVPFDAYLEMNRVSPNPAVAEQFYGDPLGRLSYPLELIAGMLDEDVTRPVGCPVVVIAASGDPLFSLDYTRQVYDRISAPAKELVVVEANEHLIFTEALDAVLPVLLPRLAAVG